MPGNIGPLEIAIVLIIALLVFGPKRLPELGKSLGRGIREFKGSITGEDKQDDDATKDLGTSAPAQTPPVETPQETEVARDKQG